MSIFAERLKELREEKELSMMQLASKLGVSDAAICKWENDLTEPRANNILSIAHFFEVSTDYLLGLESEFGVKKYSSPQIVVHTLSLDEKKLLDSFRSLPRPEQAQSLEYIQFLTSKRGNKNKHA